MESGTLVAIIGVSVANTVAFGVTLVKLGGLNQRLELLWDWYLSVNGPAPPRDRREGDAQPTRRPRATPSRLELAPRRSDNTDPDFQ